MKIIKIIIFILIITCIVYYYNNYIKISEEKKIVLPFELRFGFEETELLRDKVSKLRNEVTYILNMGFSQQNYEKLMSVNKELSYYKEKEEELYNIKSELIPRFSCFDDSSAEYFRQFPEFRENWKDKFLFLDEAIDVITYYDFDSSSETIKALPSIKGFIEDSMKKFKLAAAYIEQNKILSDTDKVRLSYIYYYLGIYNDEYNLFFNEIHNRYEEYEYPPELGEVTSSHKKIELEPELREIIDSLRPKQGYYKIGTELTELSNKYFEKAYHYAPESRWGVRAGRRVQLRIRFEERSKQQNYFRNINIEYSQAKNQIYRPFASIEFALWRSEWRVRRRGVSREVYDRERERNRKFRSARWKIRREEGRHYGRLSSEENRRYRDEGIETTFEEVYMDDMKKLAEIAVRYSEQAQALYNEFKEKQEENRAKNLSLHQQIAFNKQYFNQINNLVRDYISEINEPYMRIFQKDFNTKLFEVYR